MLFIGSRERLERRNVKRRCVFLESRYEEDRVDTRKRVATRKRVDTRKQPGSSLSSGRVRETLEQ